MSTKITELTDENPWAFMDRMEWTIHREDQVGTIRFEEVDKPIERNIAHHLGLGLCLEELRWDDTVRVIVIAGRDDDSRYFYIGPRRRPGPGEEYPAWVRRAHPSEYITDTTMNLRAPWSMSQGVERTFQTLALMEKPIIGKWTGDVIGFAGNALFGCDIIVAREDVIYCDIHHSAGESKDFARQSKHGISAPNVSAGDGALAFMPLFFTPTKLKEILLLGQQVTAKQLADLGVVNYALPPDQVDAKVEYFVQEFLRRAPVPLMRTKRALNKRLIEQYNLAQDYVYMAELLDFYQLANVDYKPDFTLRPNAPLNNGVWTYTGGGEFLPVKE